jgi:hypothetical protein
VIILSLERSCISLRKLGLFFTSSFSQMLVVAFLKEVLNDTSCSKHANSVSGHVAFHLLAVVILRDCVSAARGSWFLALLRRLHPISTSILICNTYLGGYHSLRQMSYGFIVFAFSYNAYVLFLSKECAPKVQNAIFTACFCILITCVAFSLPPDNIYSRIRQLLMYPALIHFLYAALIHLF